MAWRVERNDLRGRLSIDLVEEQQLDPFGILGIDAEIDAAVLH
jgi:hypothetical protein